MLIDGNDDCNSHTEHIMSQDIVRNKPIHTPGKTIKCSVVEAHTGNQESRVKTLIGTLKSAAIAQYKTRHPGQ